jgi:hypothetical protein
MAAGKSPQPIWIVGTPGGAECQEEMARAPARFGALMRFQAQFLCRRQRPAEITKGRAWQLSPRDFLACAWRRITSPDSRDAPQERCDANADFLFYSQARWSFPPFLAFNYAPNIPARVPLYVGRRSRTRVTQVTCEPAGRERDVLGQDLPSHSGSYMLPCKRQSFEKGRGTR